VCIVFCCVCVGVTLCGYTGNVSFRGKSCVLFVFVCVGENVFVYTGNWNLLGDWRILCDFYVCRGKLFVVIQGTYFRL
jgi:hypothetical protein